MLKRSLNARLCLLVLTLAASACSNPFGRTCTLIGCESGLSVQLLGDLPAQYTISVEVPGSGASPRVAECSPGSPCDGSVFFSEFTPDAVRVTLEADGATTSELFQPTYEVLEPNGPDCPPDCRQGTVTVQL